MHPTARLLVLLLAGATVLGGVVWLGRRAKDDLHAKDHFALMVDGLEVPVPPGMTKADFLAEVHYLSGLPDKLDRTAVDTPERLKVAFAMHPWVESVDSTVTHPLTLVLRTPTLAVNGRVLDRAGVLLPLRTATEGLPVFQKATKPFGASGRPYDDPVVVAVAQTVAWLKKQLPGVTWTKVEMTEDGLVLTRSDGASAIWGRGESTPEKKLAKLKTWTEGRIDLRK